MLGLAIAPATTADDGDRQDATSITLFTAHALPAIRRFSLTLEPAASLVEIAPDAPIAVHATSVYGLHFDGDGDLWTASADGDVACLAREQGWRAAGMRIAAAGAGGWVRGVAVDDEGGWVVSVGRDEEVRVWDRGVSVPLFFSGIFSTFRKTTHTGERRK